MFHTPIPEGDALILADNHESIMDTSIHMFFMRFDLAVIWLDRDHRVVDKTIAKKWRPYYAAKSKAQFVIEAHVNRINEFQLNDQVKFEN